MSISSKVKELANSKLEEAKKQVSARIQDAKGRIIEYIEAKRRELLKLTEQ
ncbi:hypothetical protein [Caldivirga sp. UBA161]|uniref:hypothetical protein n=1 Tax=Caldivirga sp. UBA161 TaxID=1915569 RepID=UPI0025BF1EE4|nr:hypothetical protein [Caldivirga sp. UBA161]